MKESDPFLCVIGPTASGKSARAIALARQYDGEVISVDSRQVYRLLDIGTEKTMPEDQDGIPHHLIDIRDPNDTYSAAEFVADATRLIEDIQNRGKRPILAGGTHFYFNALLHGLPADVSENKEMREALSDRSEESLMEEIRTKDPRRAESLDPKNKRRLIRALEIIEERGNVPEREERVSRYDVSWVVVDSERDELRARIDTRLTHAFERGLIEEVERVRSYVGDARLQELGLEYRIVGEYLRNERSFESLFPALSAKLWHYARRQKAWIRKLTG